MTPQRGPDVPRTEPGPRLYAQRQQAALAQLINLSQRNAPSHAPAYIRLGHSSTRYQKQRGSAVPGVIQKHSKPFILFGAIGGGVFVFGLLMQIALVRYLHLAAISAYVAQGVASVELSFVLNRYLTWRDREAAFWVSLWRWNIQKAVATLINMAVYAGMVRAGIPYILANVILTAVFTPANYLVGHAWSFANSRYAPTAPVLTDASTTWCPSVSVVIPCKKSHATIRATVTALLAQDYPGLHEVILVGDVGDSTWGPLADLNDPRVILLEQGRTPSRRDPNVKRDKGIQKSSGEVIALVDSDIVMDPGWLSQAVLLLSAQGGGMVAGGMRSIRDTFWGRFVDCNVLAAKTPRLSRPYWVTAARFGRRGYKPPVTANAVFIRAMYDACPLDINWAYGYEDYEWFWRLVQAGHRILLSGTLTAAHHHRASLRALIHEYKQSAYGCARFTHAYPDCPLARKRYRQAILLPLAGVLGAGALGVMLTVSPLGTLAVAAAAVAWLAVREAVVARHPEGLVYPFFALILGVVFTGQLARGLLETKFASRNHAVSMHPAKEWLRRHWFPAVAAAIISAGSAIRLWQLGTKPGWQVDEVTYTSLGRMLVEHGTLNVPVAYGQPWSPFLFHPPFYFLLLSRWFALTGPSIWHARILSVLATAVTLALLARLLWLLHGPRTATKTLLLVTFDGWLLYVGRISYIENTELIAIVSMFLAYQAALLRHTWRWYLATGVLAGATAIFNHTGAYVVAALVIGWVITRRDHPKHGAAVVVAAAIIAAYATMMIYLFDVNGHDWYIGQTLVQIQRILGLVHSKGTLTSPLAFLHLATSQYAVFLPSILVALAAVALLGWTLWRCFRQRSWQPLGEPVLPSWALAGVLVFGISTLRYAQYFALALIPLYCYLWTRTARMLQSRKVLRAFTAVGMTVILLASLGSFTLRVLRPSDNAFAQVLEYSQQHIPRTAIVVAESSIAYEVPQRYCSPYGRGLSSACQRNASYIITWQTYLQSANPFQSRVLARMLRNSVPVATFKGWNGTVTVRKVTRR